MNLTAIRACLLCVGKNVESNLNRSSYLRYVERKEKLSLVSSRTNPVESSVRWIRLWLKHTLTPYSTAPSAHVNAWSFLSPNTRQYSSIRNEFQLLDSMINLMKHDDNKDCYFTFCCQQSYQRTLLAVLWVIGTPEICLWCVLHVAATQAGRQRYRRQYRDYIYGVLRADNALQSAAPYSCHCTVIPSVNRRKITNVNGHLNRYRCSSWCYVRWCFLSNSSVLKRSNTIPTTHRRLLIRWHDTCSAESLAERTHWESYCSWIWMRLRVATFSDHCRCLWRRVSVLCLLCKLRDLSIWHVTF